jgi:hypothetical protein
MLLLNFTFTSFFTSADAALLAKSSSFLFWFLFNRLVFFRLSRCGHGLGSGDWRTGGWYQCAAGDPIGFLMRWEAVLPIHRLNG